MHQSPITDIMNIMRAIIKQSSLTDTERLYTQVTQEISDRYGKTYTWELKASLMGFTGREAAHKLIEGIGLPMTPEEYMREAHLLYEQHFPNAQLLPGNTFGVPKFYNEITTVNEIILYLIQLQGLRSWCDISTRMAFPLL